MLGSWEIAHIDPAHRKLSKTGLRCSGNILEGGVLFIELQLCHWQLIEQQGFKPITLIEIPSCDAPHHLVNS